MGEGWPPPWSNPGSGRRIARVLDDERSASIGTPRGSPLRRVRSRARASLRGVLLPPGQRRRAADAAAARGRRRPPSRLHPAHAPHPPPPHTQRRASSPEALQRDLRVTREQ